MKEQLPEIQQLCEIQKLRLRLAKMGEGSRRWVGENTVFAKPGHRMELKDGMAQCCAQRGPEQVRPGEEQHRVSRALAEGPGSRGVGGRLAGACSRRGLV